MFCCIRYVAAPESKGFVYQRAKRADEGNVAFLAYYPRPDNSSTLKTPPPEAGQICFAVPAAVVGDASRNR
jgi:hypothetical protein